LALVIPKNDDAKRKALSYGVSTINFNYLHSSPELHIEFNLEADTKSIVQTRTVCTTQVDKNRHNRTFYNA